jgi:hypothetical protein
MKTQVNVVTLPTEKASHIGFYTDPKDTRLYFNSSKTPLLKNQPNWKPQHLYFLSDDEIKEEDWCYDTLRNIISKCIEIIPKDIKPNDYLVFEGNMGNPRDTYKKIIATTDESLGLPRPSNEFLKKFCELGGVDKVLVEYEIIDSQIWLKNQQNFIDKTEVEIIKLKVAPDNTITIYPI